MGKLIKLERAYAVFCLRPDTFGPREVYDTEAEAWKDIEAREATDYATGVLMFEDGDYDVRVITFTNEDFEGTPPLDEAVSIDYEISEADEPWDAA